MQTLLILAKSPEKQKLNFSRNAPFHMKARVSLKHLMNACLWKQVCAFNSPQTSPKLISLTILVTVMPFT